jgi:hypothetical protein
MVDCKLCGVAIEEAFPDDVFCGQCESELMNWFGGFAHARPHDLLGSHPVPVAERGWLTPEACLCYLCGDAPAEHIEHLHPRIHGGPDRLPNVGLACPHCNGVKGSRIVDLDAAQTRRFAGQQSEFARRYADVQSLVPMAWLQAVTREYWELYQADGFELVDADPDWVAEIVAYEVQHRLELREDMKDPPPYLPDDWAQRAVDAGVPILNLYSQREWLEAPLTDDAAREVMTTAVDELPPPFAP